MFFTADGFRLINIVDIGDTQISEDTKLQSKKQTDEIQDAQKNVILSVEL